MRIDGTALLLIFLAVMACVGLKRSKLSSEHTPGVSTGDPERPSPVIPTTLDEAAQCLIDDYNRNHTSQF